MINHVRDEIKQNRLIINKFYYAYCEKSPNTLHFSHVMDWSAVSRSLQKIIFNQLEFLICKGKMQEQNYKSQHTGSMLTVDRSIKVPNGYIFPVDDTVLNTLSSLLSANTQAEEDFHKGCDLLALKFLTATKSRTSVYGLITFEANINQTNHKFIFITLCDLDKEFENLRVDEIKQELVLEVIKNVFSEKNLTKGVLFPFIDFTSKDPGNFVLFDREQTLYWAEAFECKSKLTAASERTNFQTLLRDQVFADTQKTSGIWTEIEQKMLHDQTLPLSVISKDHMKQASKEINVNLDEEEFDQQWRDLFKEDGYSISVENIRSEKSKFSIQMDKIKIDAPISELKRLQQFKHGDKIYLVISANDFAKIKEVNSPIEEITWEDFKGIVEG